MVAVAFCGLAFRRGASRILLTNETRPINAKLPHVGSGAILEA